jgi:hypothetical protein
MSPRQEDAVSGATDGLAHPFDILDNVAAQSLVWVVRLADFRSFEMDV